MLEDFFFELSFMGLTDPNHLMSPSLRQSASICSVGSSVSDDIWKVTLCGLLPL